MREQPEKHLSDEDLRLKLETAMRSQSTSFARSLAVPLLRELIAYRAGQIVAPRVEAYLRALVPLAANSGLCDDLGCPAGVAPDYDCPHWLDQRSCEAALLAHVGLEPEPAKTPQEEADDASRD